MTLIVGLGNPGEKYRQTRHNLGFMLLKALAHNQKFKHKHKSLILKTDLQGEVSLLAQPQTFMNLSGLAVKEIMNFYKIPIQKLLLIHDDKDLAFGLMKFQKNRGAGGHNGVAHVHQELGTPDYCRLKMGVGANPKEANSPTQPLQNTSHYVLSPFNSTEKKQLPLFLKQATQAVFCFLTKGYQLAANQFNSNK